MLKKWCIVLKVYDPCEFLSKKRMRVDTLVVKNNYVEEFSRCLKDFNLIRGRMRGKK